MIKNNSIISIAIQKLSSKKRKIETAFKTNARLLKLALKRYSTPSAKANTLIISLTIAPDSTPIVDVPSTKQRGRPKKATNNETITPERTIQKAIMKRRGRPRMTTTTSPQNATVLPNTEKPLVSTKKRGPPRKLPQEIQQNG